GMFMLPSCLVVQLTGVVLFGAIGGLLFVDDLARLAHADVNGVVFAHAGVGAYEVLAVFFRVAVFEHRTGDTPTFALANRRRAQFEAMVSVGGSNFRVCALLRCL